MNAFLLVLNLFLILAYVHRRKFSIFSSTDIFLLFFYTIMFTSIIYQYAIPPKLKVNLYNFDYKNSKKFTETIFIFIKLINYFLIGHVLYKIKYKEYQILIRQKVRFTLSSNLMSYPILDITIIVSIFSLLLLFMDYGIGIFYRLDYIPYKSSVYKLIYTLLFLIISFISGFYFKNNRPVYLTLFIIILLACIGIGSRIASINLIVFLLALYIQKTKGKGQFLLLSALIILVFFGYNISLRSESNQHGLIPYLMITFEKPEIIFDYIYINIYYNLVFGVYATADTVTLYTHNITENLMISLNPLPGRIAGWYKIADKMRLNKFAPFTGIGEVYKSPYFFSVYWIIIGAYFTSLDMKIKKLFIDKNYFLSLIILLFITLFCVLIFEYNFRSSNRFIYYSFLISFFYFIKIKNGKIYLKR